METGLPMGQSGGQNIHAFCGASVGVIRRCTEDYGARTQLLVENFRSTRHIIEAANCVIAGAASRMKAQPTRVDAARAQSPPGGRWQHLDPVAQGRVQILPAGSDAQEQALAIHTELQRMMALGMEPAQAALVARQWQFLDPLRAALEAAGIAVTLADEEAPPLWRLREVQALLGFLEERQMTSQSRLINPSALASWLASRQDGSGGWPMLDEAIAAFAEDTGDPDVPLDFFHDWLAEWGRVERGRQAGILLLTTHRAKGLEFDHVFILDGGWEAGRSEDPDAALRLYYVAMTRARATLTLACMDPRSAPMQALNEQAFAP